MANEQKASAEKLTAIPVAQRNDEKPKIENTIKPIPSKVEANVEAVLFANKLTLILILMILILSAYGYFNLRKALKISEANKLIIISLIILVFVFAGWFSFVSYMLFNKGIL